MRIDVVRRQQAGQAVELCRVRARCTNGPTPATEETFIGDADEVACLSHYPWEGLTPDCF